MAPDSSAGPGPSASALKLIEVRTLADINDAIARILAEMGQAGYTEREQFGARLSLEEAIVNGIKHGNHEDPAKVVRIRYRISAVEFHAEIEDEGPGFDPERVPDPLAPENIERPGGRGVFLMRHYMTSVHYNERGNAVTLCKLRDG